jgi:hypothetical protein
MLVRNVNQSDHYGNPIWKVLKKLKLELPYAPAISFLGTYLRESKSAFSTDT